MNIYSKPINSNADTKGFTSISNFSHRFSQVDKPNTKPFDLKLLLSRIRQIEVPMRFLLFQIAIIGVIILVLSL